MRYHQRAVMPVKRLVRMAFFGGLWLLACRREAPEKAPPERPSARPSAAPAPDLASLRRTLGIRGDAGLEPAALAPSSSAAPRKLKVRGALGEWLESDLFFFRAVSMRACGDRPSARAAADAGGAKKAARITLGAEVEIKAKLKMTVSPREVRLSSGAVVYESNLDLERRLEGCTPLLKVSWLKPDDVIKGFVLFDVPLPEPKDLRLGYQPTRWGGAGPVVVTLPECVSCGTDGAPAKPAGSAR
jgi:hypothetical protein